MATSSIKTDALPSEPPKAIPNPKEKASKQRIITHMNADHKDVLVRYLENYGKIPTISARSAKLTDITFSTMTITHNHGKATSTIPISPPLTGWSQAREKTITMDNECMDALNRSHITVKEYAPPTGFHAVVFMACLLTFIAFSRRTNFRPGSLIYDYIFSYVPDFARFCHLMQPIVLYPMILLHGWEAGTMATSRLQKHNVPYPSRLWWLWVGSCFIEGAGSFRRLDGLVNKEKARREKEREAIETKKSASQ
ncbi:hypothetical protein MMC25_002750 [Agyrium rufum]|nr:hypothetical protein [Agyrium rufum]